MWHNWDWKLRVTFIHHFSLKICASEVMGAVTITSGGQGALAKPRNPVYHQDAAECLGPGGEPSAVSSAESQKLQPGPHCPVASEDRSAHRAAHASPAHVGSASGCAWCGTRRCLQLAGYFRLETVFPCLRQVEQL